ncbi:MAG: YqaJ viral recombinase family protein [Oscillospiraceae bacterium]|nr:YqaJ viral recombinase family protein [Oscillospiraceae bacterium]
MKESYQPSVLVDTDGLSREEWLNYRRQGIGGSDAAAVLGISPWRTARDLYYDKLGVVSVFDEVSSWVQLEVGHLLEPLVARIFEKKTGFKVYQRKSMFQHPAYPWMLADLDYLVELPDGGTAILEIKTCNYNAKDNWWYNGKEIVPIYYESQARHYMCVMNIDRVYFCCLYGNTEDETIIRTLDRDMDYENELITLESAFWNDYVLAKNPPPYTEGGDLIMESLNRWLGPNEKDIPPTELDVSQYALVQRYMELQQQRGRCDTDKKAIESEMNRIKALIIAAMGRSSTAFYDCGDGGIRVTYNPVRKPGISKENLDRLKIVHPDIYDEFVTIQESRRFSIKQTKPLAA